MRKRGIITLLVMQFTIGLLAAEPRIRPMDFSQQVSPNSDGEVEGATRLFFNWGALRSGIVYKSESVVDNYLDADQDTFINQRSKIYDLVILKTRDGLIGTKKFFFNPFIGTKLVKRTEKRIGENLASGNEYWFTENNNDTFVNFYGSSDIVFKSKPVDITVTVGGGYLLKKTSGDFRNSTTDPDLDYSSSDYGFNFYTDVNLLLKPSSGVAFSLSFSYNREASYFERFYVQLDRRDNYAYYVHEMSYGVHIYFKFLEKVLSGVPFVGLTYIDYRREIQTGTKEKMVDSRFKFDIGVKL